MSLPPDAAARLRAERERTAALGIVRGVYVGRGKGVGYLVKEILEASW